MIPPMLLTPVAKISGIALGLALIFGWGYLKGRAAVQESWDAAVSQQAQASAAQVLAEAQLSNQVLKGHAEATREAERRVETIEREVIRYVQAPDKPCPVDPDFVRLFDELSRLPGAGTDRMPAADAGAGELVEPPDAGLTTTEVVQAYYRAIDELTFLWLDYQALVQWERGRYIVQQAQQGDD